MKKILSLLFFAAIFSKAFSQVHGASVFVGANYTGLSTSGTTNPDFKSNGYVASFSAGVIDDINYGFWAIHTGVIVSGKGGNFIENDIKKRVRLDYLEIPIDFILQQNKGKSGFYIGAGPYLGAAFGGILNVHDPKNHTVTNLSLFKNTSLYRVGNIGAEGVLGYRFKSPFSVNASYDSDFFNGLSKKGNPNGDKSIKNRTFSLSVGYSLH